MIHDTKDILFLVLAVSFSAITVMIVWMFVYLIGILRDVHRATRQISEVASKAHGILEMIEGTVSRSSNHLSLIVTAVQQLVGFVRNRHADDADDEDDQPRRKTKRA